MRRIIEVTREKEVNAPIEKVFNFVAEYGNTLKYTPYLVRFEPTTEIKRGSGARFSSGWWERSLAFLLNLN